MLCLWLVKNKSHSLTASFAPRNAGAQRVFRARFFRLNPVSFVVLSARTPNCSLPIRSALALPRPPNLESQYQRM